MAKIGVYQTSPVGVDDDNDPLEVTVVGGDAGGGATEDTLQDVLTAIGSTNTALGTIDGRVDGLEALIGTTNTTLSSVDGHVDGLETLVTASNAALDLLAPSASAAAVTPHDSNNLSATSRGIYVGTTGDVTAVINGNAITFKTVPAGMILPIRCTRINATATTASNMVALF